MRQRFSVFLAAVGAIGLLFGSARADQVEISGVHICCGSCVRDAEAVLKGVEGLSDIKVDQKTKTIVFKAASAETSTGAFKALLNAGYYGKATLNGKEFAIKSEPVTDVTANEFTVANVHICCGACRNAITKLFPDAKVSFPAKNEFKVEGKDLAKSKILSTLQNAGFTGAVKN